jgi:hypothetical protein
MEFEIVEKETENANQFPHSSYTIHSLCKFIPQQKKIE